MATSRSLEEFSRRATIIAAGVVKNFRKSIVKAALVADQVAILATPVDTGRARANWIASIGAPATEADRAPDKSGQVALNEAQRVVARYAPGQGGIYITNNVEYIEPLDQGSSSQAPNGMTAQAIQAATMAVRNIKILAGI